MKKSIFYLNSETIKKENSSFKRGITGIKKVVAHRTTKELLSAKDIKILEEAELILDDLLYAREQQAKMKKSEEIKSEREKSRKEKIVSDLTKSETLDFKVRTVLARWRLVSIWDKREAEKEFLDTIITLDSEADTKDDFIAVINKIKEKLENRDTNNKFNFAGLDERVADTMERISENENRRD